MARSGWKQPTERRRHKERPRFGDEQEGTKTRRDLWDGGRGRRGRRRREGGGTSRHVLLVGGEEEEGGEEHPADERDEAHGRGRASPPPPDCALCVCLELKRKMTGL